MPKGIYNRKLEETEKLKKRMRENNPTKSPVVREKIKNAHLNTKLTEIHKKRISDSEKNNLPKTAFTKGIKPWNYIDGRSKNKSPDRYGDDWDAIRYLVYLRDHFTCQRCGIKGERLDVHHKIPFLISFDNSLNNLISLCKPCHRKEEARIMKELQNQEVELCPT